MPQLLLKDLPRYECLLDAAREFPDLDPSAMEAYLHLLRTGDEVFNITEQSLTSHGITHGRFGVLMLLWRSPATERSELPSGSGTGCDCVGPRTPAELAEAAGVTRATMTGLIDTLERDGYVRREPDPVDRRMMSVFLTTQGEAFLHEFLPGHFKIISRLMTPLNEAERKTFVRLLVKIQDHSTALHGKIAAQPAAT